MRYPVILTPEREGGYLVTLPDIPEAITHGATRAAALARRMKIPRQAMTRLLDPRHTTKIDSIANALTALGNRLEMNVA